MLELTEEQMERAARALADWDEDNGHDWWASAEKNYAAPGSDYDRIGKNYRNYYREGVRIVLAALNAKTPV